MNTKPTLMKDELNQLIERFPDNPYTTQWQKETYLNEKGQKRIISHEQFARELPENKNGKTERPILMLFPKNPQPVGSLGHKATRGYWYHDNDGHTAIPMADMVRICFFFHCDLFETLRLALKNEWEKYLAKRRGYKLNMGAPYSEFVPGEELVEDDFAEFKPDYQEIISTMRALEFQIQHYADTLDPAFADLRFLKENNFYLEPVIYAGVAKEMILSRLFLEAQDSPAFLAFVSQQQQEIKQSLVEQRKNQAIFWQKKCYWLELQEEHVQLMYDQEKLNLDQAYTKKHFLGLFGAEYIALQETVFAIALLKRKIMHKQNDPGLSEASILQLLKQQEAEAEKYLGDLQYWAYVQMPEIKPQGNAASDEEEQKYALEVKQTLRGLEKMLHPDLMKHHENYSKLTEEQIKRLRNLWERMMEVKSLDCIYAEGTIGRSYPSLIKLKIIKMEAKQIFFSLGLAWDAKYCIQGQDVEQRIHWLEEHIALYEVKIQDAKQRLMAIAQDQRIKEMRAVLQAPLTHEKYKKSMADEVARLEAEKTALAAEWDKLINGGGRHDA